MPPRPSPADARYRLIHGDCLDVMRTMDAGSVDAVVTDPPYALTSNKRGGSGVASINTETPYGRARIGTGNGSGGFMGKAWDSELPTVDMWSEALRVAKPGAHLLAFGGTRTFHRLTCAIEDAGWEIRDCLSWLYGSGFPKSHNGAWGGTALKPAWEPIILARKPLIGTVKANHAAHGTGALNIDGCRIGTDERFIPPAGNDGSSAASVAPVNVTDYSGRVATGRWPANVVLDDEAAKALDDQSGATTSNDPGTTHVDDPYFGLKGERRNAGYDGDFGGASRFFYTSKASRAEREAGLNVADAVPAGVTNQSGRGFSTKCGKCDGYLNRNDGAKPCRCESPEMVYVRPTRANTHPTVKPVDLMRWLVRLVTPPGGLVLDPFTGSGSTGVASIEEGCSFIGIEREAEYVAIAEARLKHASRAPLLPFDDGVTKAIAAQLAFDMGTTRDEAEVIVRAKLAAGEKSVDV